MASERTNTEGSFTAERDRLIAENNRLRQELQERYGLSNIVGGSRAMRLVCEQIADAARAGGPVLLRGEPGTGKALVARAIHHSSSRSHRPFVRVRCAALPEAVVDSQLFGEIKGTLVASPGGIQRVDGGTLFVDEVGGIGIAAQERLLRVIRDHVMDRPGGGTVRVDVRLIAATSDDLVDAVTAGTVRHDFYELLSVRAITVPPLRDRKADLPVLIDLFLERFAREHARSVERLSTRAMDMLIDYDWPGNVRELSAVIERALVLTTGPVIHHHCLPTVIQERAGSGLTASMGLSEALDAYEKELLEEALKRAHGVRSKAARLLHTTDRIFRYKLRKHGIDCRQFKVSG